MVTKIHAEDRTFKFKVADTKEEKMRRPTSSSSQMPSSSALRALRLVLLFGVWPVAISIISSIHSTLRGGRTKRRRY